ncbi:DUF4352 domain-containing protein [Candidatus Corynebacterium faecigallinarum]|uniref:DUF4352 domain-containing protein n=1 Tax=Candidatus Corynebacterium faecigallinarum TaxID=2838528 RepID=UPI003FD24AC8
MTHPNGPQDHNPQQMPYGQLPPQGYSPQPQPEKKPIYKKKRFIIPVAAIVIIGGAMAFSNSGDDNPTSTSSSASDGEQQNTGPAAIGDTVHLKNADITTTNFRDTGADSLGDNHLCVDYHVVNTSDSDSIEVGGLIDWKMTDPGNVTVDSTYGGESNDDPAEVGPGGEKSGTVCFAGSAQPGDYKLKFEETLSFTSKPAEWTGPVA